MMIKLQVHVNPSPLAKREPSKEVCQVDNYWHLGGQAGVTSTLFPLTFLGGLICFESKLMALYSLVSSSLLHYFHSHLVLDFLFQLCEI